MANIILRAVKGTPLTNDELDSNINSINSELVNKATELQLTTAINNLNAALTADIDALSVLLDSKLSNTANSVSDTNLQNSSVTPTKISQVSATWSFVGTLNVNGNISSNNNTANFFSGVSSQFGSLVVTGASALGAITGTSLNSTPIGNISPSTGAFTTLSAITASFTNISGAYTGLASLAANSTVVTPNLNDSSTKVASTAYVQGSGKNSQGSKTISTSGPYGGVNGDVWYQY